MGAPSQAQAQAWTDDDAARLQLILNGHYNGMVGRTQLSAWDQVDASGDPAVEIALQPSAQNLDTYTLPENLGTLMAREAQNPWLAARVNALSALVTSAAGGGYASLGSYLSAVGATVHPLWGEMAGRFLSTPGSVVFAPNYQAISAQRVYIGANGALTEETTDAGSAATADVNLFTSNNHYLYIGSRYKFSQVVAALSTVANVTIAPAVQYYNGTTWVAVAGLTDDGTGFTKNDRIKWTLPTDWVRTYKDGGGTVFPNNANEPLYYVRIQRTAATVATPPVMTCLRLIPAAVYTSGSTARHLGVDQPPLAILRITGVNTVVVEAVAAVDHQRFIPPAIGLRALTPISADTAFTLSYVDQSGNAAETKAQTAWGGAAAALDTKAMTLNAPDTGVRSIPTTGWAVTTAATQGVLAVYAAALRTPAI